jgi:predicted unusual protein kinase regulating ubiquinone biosynthesis (AarF/ABC1/UbiB family)
MARVWKRWSRRNRLWRSLRVGSLLLRTLFIVNRERSRVVQARARGDYDVRPNLKALVRVLHEFRVTAIDLGGLMIKLGQFLGARADLLPDAALAELAALHDDVPAEPFADVRGALEREWHVPLSEICASIDEAPDGSASLGQVHHAILQDGREVAIKVQRPGIDAIVRTDLRTLRFVLRLVGQLVPVANTIVDLRALYREFSRTVAEELDYQQEARNAERFAAIFADDPTIRVPAMIPAYSTRRVLVMQWMDGIKIANVAALDTAHVNRKRLANRLVGTYFTQVLEASFFHADPHPGNFLVQPDPAGDRLVFLDFGMMGLVTPRMRAGIREATSGYLAKDAAVIVRGLDKLGFLSETADREALEPVVNLLLARFGDLSALSGGAGGPFSGRRGAVDPQEAIDALGTTLYDQPFRLPVQFAYFGRMVGMLQGVATALDPNFNMLAVATPYAQEFLGNGDQGSLEGILRLLGVESVADLGQSLLRDGVALAQSLARLPRRLDRVLDRAERGEIHLVIEPADRSSRARRGFGRSRSRHGGPALLNRPVPLWMPLGMAGALGMVAISWFARHNPKAKPPRS